MQDLQYDQFPFLCYFHNFHESIILFEAIVFVWRGPLLHACRQIVERFETQTHSQQPEAVVHVEALPLSRTFTVSCTATRLCSRKGEEEEKEKDEM